MKIVFAVIFILIIIEFVFFILTVSTITLSIKDCDFSYSEKTLDKFKIRKINCKIRVNAFGKFNYFGFNFNERYISIMKIKLKHKIIDNFEISIFKILRKIKNLVTAYEKITIKILKPKVKSLDVYSAIGMPEDMYTYFVLPLFSIFITFKLREYIDKYKIESCKYEVIPRYIKRLYFKLILNTEIEVKLVDLIRFICYVKRTKK